MSKFRISSQFALPVEAVTETFAILAKRGVGKTYTAKKLAEQILKSGAAPVVVADPVGVWWGLRSSADGKGPGLPILVLGGDYGDAPLESGAGEVVARMLVEERLSAVLDLSRFRKNEQTQFMTAFAERLYHENREALHLMLDEADAFAPQKPYKGQERLLGAVEDLVRRGHPHHPAGGRHKQRRAHPSRSIGCAAYDCAPRPRSNRSLDSCAWYRSAG